MEFCNQAKAYWYILYAFGQWERVERKSFWPRSVRILIAETPNNLTGYDPFY